MAKSNQNVISEQSTSKNDGGQTIKVQNKKFVDLDKAFDQVPQDVV